MTQETAEVVVETTQATPDPKVVELEQQIATLTSQVDEAKREAKSHQEYGRKTKAELDKQQGLDGKVTRLEKRLEVATDMIAALLDKEDGLEEEPQPKRKSETYRSRLAETEKETKETQEQHIQKLAREADGLLKSVGLKMYDPDTGDNPETAVALTKFLVGNAEAGLEEVRKIVTEKQKTEVKPETKSEVNPEIDMKKAIADGVQAYLKEKGYLDSDNGSPGGSATSAQQAMQDYISGKITSDEARKRGVNFD